MVKVYYGKKGSGKTKTIIDEANKIASDGGGDVVFIDYSNQRMYDLKHDIRFVNVSDFPVRSNSCFIGFICGIVSEDYDVEAIFVDGLTHMLDDGIETLEGFFKTLEDLSAKFNIKFYLSVNGDNGEAPSYLGKYIS